METSLPASPWLVTGAAGFLGSHVVEQLLRRNRPTIAVDNLSSGDWRFLAPFAGDPNFTFVCQDIRDEGAMTALCRRRSPAAVIHLAALHFIPAAIANPATAVSLNVHGTQCVLSAAREAQVPTIFFASTADVYAASDAAHRESDPVAPFNIYGLTKAMSEDLIRIESGMRPAARFAVGRLFNLYGPRETNPHILPEIIRQIRNGTEVLRLGLVTPKRDLVPVADAARAVLDLVEKAGAGITTVNIGTGATVSIQEVIERIAQLTGRPLRIETDPAKVRPVERHHLQAEVSALRSRIGWSPHTDLTRGLHDLLQGEGIAVS